MIDMLSIRSHFKTVAIEYGIFRWSVVIYNSYNKIGLAEKLHINLIYKCVHVYCLTLFVNTVGI